MEHIKLAKNQVIRFYITLKINPILCKILECSGDGPALPIAKVTSPGQLDSASLRRVLMKDNIDKAVKRVEEALAIQWKNSWSMADDYDVDGNHKAAASMLVDKWHP